MRSTALLLLLVCSLARADVYEDVAKILGPGQRIPAGYRQIRLRTDLQVQNHAGMLISPEMGLETKVRFSGDALEGELCLLRDEIDPVIDRLRGSGMEVVGLSNRLAGESPGVYFLQFRGSGTAVSLANGLKSALDELGVQRLVNEGLQRTGVYPVVDWKAIAVILAAPVTQIGSSRVWMGLEEGKEARFGGCPCGRTQLRMRMQIGRGAVQRSIDAARKGKLTLTSLTMAGDRFDATFEGEGEATRLAGAVRAVWSAS